MFKDIEKFILQARQNKDNRSGEDVEGETKLSFVNSFPARDRAFLSKIAGDLNLVLTWDEYNDKDENLAVLRLPNVSSNGNANEGNDDESSEDDGGEAGRAAVDRVLNKYKRANILEDEGTAEERYDATLKKRMEDWKRQYYRVRCGYWSDWRYLTDKLDRKNWTSNSMTIHRWTNSCIAILKAYNGSCIIIIKVSPRGDGSTTITTPQEFPVRNLLGP